jgi:hypothetical protein
MTVKELLGRVDSRELTEWKIYCQYDPIGNERADMHNATIISTLINIFRGKKQKAVKPEECMLKFGPKRQKTMAEMKAILKAVGFK